MFDSFVEGEITPRGTDIAGSQDRAFLAAD